MNTTYVALFILVLFFVSILIWVYEGTIAPTLRMILRNEVFTLRDLLRKKYFESAVEEDEYEFLEKALNLTVQNSKRIDFFLLTRVNASIAKNRCDEKNERLFKKLSSNDVSRLIMSEHHKIIGNLILTNSFFLIFMIFPFVCPALIFEKTKNKISSAIQKIESLKQNDIERIYPDVLALV